MKIAVVKREASRNGGLEKYTRRLIEAFKEKQAEVTLVTSGRKSQSPESVSFPLRSPLTYRNLARFDDLSRRFLEENPHDLVLGMDRTSFPTYLRAGNGVHAAYLDIRRRHEGFWKGHSFSFNPLHRLILKLEKSAFENPALKFLCVNSDLVRRQVLERYRVDPKKITVIHNGVEWDELAAPFAAWEEQRPKIAHRLGLDLSRFHFLFIGHNFARKGLNILLQALAQLQGADFHLSIVGEDKHRPRFEALAQELGLASRVSFWGHQENILPFYQLCDALAIPSLYDPFANVTVEALAMGLFVVTSEMNGGKEVVMPMTGLLAPLEEFSSALALALKHPKNPEKARTIRTSVESLDFSKQLSRFCDACISSS